MSTKLTEYYTDANPYIHDDAAMTFDEISAEKKLKDAVGFIKQNEIDKIEKDYFHSCWHGQFPF